ncbi:MAG: class I SAM-dependent methyltransferase [Lactobacillaceae bacterium]|jgi:site-specific DNA-methyltransferase (adenine-specific)|nr:class I SAM-dependent methyltransferase [Lactobacillaceae bacterium]
MFEQIEKAVNELQAGQDLIREELDISSVEALIILFSQMLEQSDDEFDALADQVQSDVEQAIKRADFKVLNGADQRQVLQFLLVGTMLKDHLPANYQITPDAIGMWVGYFVEQFVGKKAQVKLADFGIGSGNLLATVQQVMTNEHVEATGFENDDTMLTLASGVIALLKRDWKLELEDVIAVDSSAEFDLVLGDLPVGYYPAQVPDDFKTSVEEPNELTFVHHLLAEKALKVLKPGGQALLLVPANLFESEQAPKLLAWLQTDEVLFQAFIQFPGKMFADQSSQKALLILQKPGENVKQAEPVLLAKVPELTNKTENQAFIAEFSRWIAENQMISE